MLITHGIETMATVGDKVNITDTTGVNWQFDIISVLTIRIDESGNLHELQIEFRGTICDHRFIRIWLT